MKVVNYFFFYLAAVVVNCFGEDEGNIANKRSSNGALNDFSDFYSESLKPEEAVKRHLGAALNSRYLSWRHANSNDKRHLGSAYRAYKYRFPAVYTDSYKAKRSRQSNDAADGTVFNDDPQVLQNSEKHALIPDTENNKVGLKDVAPVFEKTILEEKRHLGSALNSWKSFARSRPSSAHSNSDPFTKRHLGSALRSKYRNRSKRYAVDVIPDGVGLSKRHIGSILRTKSKGFYVTKYRPSAYKYYQAIRRYV